MLFNTLKSIVSTSSKVAGISTESAIITKEVTVAATKAAYNAGVNKYDSTDIKGSINELKSIAKSEFNHGRATTRTAYNNKLATYANNQETKLLSL